MSQSPEFAGLRHRDYFHIMLNLDSYEGFLPTAKTLAEGFLDAAGKKLKDGALEPELRAFPYSDAAFSNRLDEIYQGLADDVRRYEEQRGWTRRTRADVLEWMLQMAPFNQTDGAWLRTIAPVGPMDEVEALLFSIYSEEIGAGDPERNHANMYTELLRSVDIDLPDVRSRDYAQHPGIVDAAYTLPLFQLVVSQFPQDYFPELLGMTQYLEWSSVELRSQVLLNRHFGIDTRFYEMHVAIDNATAGHGAMAKRAVQGYLEQVRVDLGDEAMQAQWARIWTGYVAFATTGNLGQQVADKLRRRVTPAERVVTMIRDRAPKARLNHGTRRLGGKLLNDLFADPAALMTALVSSGRIVPGDPERSSFFELVGPDGPMYRVFSDADIAVWRDWTRSLAAPAPVPAPEPVPVPVDPGARMVALIETMRPIQEGAYAHRSEKLKGPDPEDPSRTADQSVAWWFNQPARALMAALSREENGWVTPGSARDSRLITDLVTGRTTMGRALRARFDASGATRADVIIAWIDAGCPIPDEVAARPLTLLSPPDRVDAHPTGAIHGTGSVH
jgi:Iron-containing redox enzyme